MKDLWIAGGWVVAMDPGRQVWEDGVVHLSGGKIQAVGAAKDLTIPPDAEVLDASGGIVLPGLINTHTHSPMTLFRGAADDLPLDRWLGERIFPLEQTWANEAYSYLGTQLAALEMVRGGTTTLSDMYFYQDHVARALNESGMRALCGQTIVEVSDVDNSSARYLEKCEELIEEFRQWDRIELAVAPHSEYTVSQKTWESIIAFAAEHELLVHTHLSETAGEVEGCRERHGMSPVRYFDQLGLWKLPRVLAAHAVCLDSDDIEILGTSRVGVAHNIESNQKLGTGVAPVPELIREGARVGLGTDGAASNNNLDLFQEAGSAARAQSQRVGPGEYTAMDALASLTCNGAAALGRDDLGSLEAGKRGDVIVVDARVPHLTPLYDAYSQLIYAAGAQDVRHTVVDGEILMKDRQLTRVDESAILHEAREWGKKVRTSL